jgi:hypothetical protein
MDFPNITFGRLEAIGMNDHARNPQAQHKAGLPAAFR